MNKGFFKSSKELSKPIVATGCASCGLSSGCLHPKMEPSGEGKKRILFIAEAPGADEDRLGTQLIGKVGQRLRRTLRSLDIDLDKDCRKTNSVICRPPGNETPTDIQIATCKSNIFDEINRSKPNVIIPLGGCALKSVLSDRWKRDKDFSVGRWRGLAIPDHELKAWICPTFHPSYIERSDNFAPAASVIWRNDLARAVKLFDKPLPPYPSPTINILKDSETVEKFLLNIWRDGKKSVAPFLNLKPGTPEWMECWKRFPKSQNDMLEYGKNPDKFNLPIPSTTIAFDYETTGLKPYGEGHTIACVSIADSSKTVSVWMWRDCPIPMYKSVMEELGVRKIAGNMKFEHVWTRQICGFEVKNWWWDTVVAGKTLDNRPRNSSVKFQAYRRLGVVDYDSSITPFLVAEDSKSLNRVFEAPERDLLEYCAMDSILEYLVCFHQRREMMYEDLFVDGGDV